MVGGLKVILVKEGKAEEFERMFGELRAKVREHEPGTTLYSLLKSRKDPRAYIVHDQYRDQAALDAHQASAHGKVYFPAMRTILEKIDVEYYDVVVE